MKRAIAAMGLLLLAMATPALAENLTAFNGYLFSKLEAIGTRSEGPGYFLQTFDGRDIPIQKHAMLWQSDPALQAFLATKVTIEGELTGGTIDYRNIKAYVPMLRPPGH